MTKNNFKPIFFIFTALSLLMSSVVYSNDKIVMKKIKQEKKTSQIDDAEGHFNLGISYAKSGKFKEALKALKKAITINPDYADAHFSLGGVYGILGKFQEALEPLKQVIRITPNLEQPYRQLGFAYFELERYFKAIDPFKQAITLDPNNADSFYFLGLSYNSLEKHSEAIEAFNQALKLRLKGVFEQNAHYELGIAFNNLKDIESALKEYEILKKLNSKHFADKLFSKLNNNKCHQGFKFRSKSGIESLPKNRGFTLSLSFPFNSYLILVIQSV